MKVFSGQTNQGRQKSNDKFQDPATLGHCGHDQKEECTDLEDNKQNKQNKQEKLREESEQAAVVNGGGAAVTDSDRNKQLEVERRYHPK